MTDLDTAWAVAARGPGSLEVVELEERLHDEPICQGTETDHSAPCTIIATHRLKMSCPSGGVTLLVCRVIAECVLGPLAGERCDMCGRPVSVCWVVTEL